MTTVEAPVREDRVWTHGSVYVQRKPWMVSQCSDCERSVMLVLDGQWAHVTDFNGSETDHLPTPQRAVS